MFLQERHPAEGLRTAGAGVLLHFLVGLQVGAKVGSVGECPMAVFAFERFLTGMGSDMALKEPRPRESLSADIALAGEGMGANVHLQGSH